MIDGGLLLIGAGNMGGAMLHRWLVEGLHPARVTVVSPSGRTMPAGVHVVPAIPHEGSVEVAVLACKPQQLSALGASLAMLSPGLLLSVLAGVEAATLARACPSAGAIVRAMPNLPVAIGRGVTALHTSAGDAAARARAEALARPLGHFEWIGEEALFDAVTALSGCGPGFVFRFIDALARAGTILGLSADQSARLALATVEGSAAMALASDLDPAALADRVASPGGSTREGLDVLDADGRLDALLRETLSAARDRNVAMAITARG